jgi:hypothetical protein
MNELNSLLPFPSQFEDVINVASRAFGTSDVATRLLMLDAIAAAAGNLIQIRTPEFSDYIPALNLAVIAGHDSIPRGALMALISPVEDIVYDARMFRQMRGPQLAQASFEDSVRERQHLESLLEKETGELHDLGPELPPTPQQQQEAADDIMGIDPGKPPGPIVRRQQLVESIAQARDRLAAVKRGVARLRLENRVHVLLKDLPWSDWPAKTAQSFDGNSAALIFDPGLMRELCTLPRRELKACAAALQRTLSGSPMPGDNTSDLLPGTWAVLCGEQDIWSRIFDRSAIVESGLLHDFVFCEAGGEGQTCDSAAIVELAQCETWRGFLENLFLQRMCDSPSTMVFNIEGARQFLELRRWCRQFAAGLSPEVRPHFTHWPQMAARVALGLGIMHNAAKGETLTASFIAIACVFARAYAPIQAALLEKFHSGDSKAVLAEREMQRAVRKLRTRGPLTLRGLVRTYDKQDYAVIEDAVHRGIERGLVKQQGPLFFAVSVSDSPGSEARVLNFTERVSP